MNQATLQKHLKVLVVEDHPVVRMGLAALIDDQDDMELCAQAADGDEAIALFERHEPDVTLMDLRLPRRSGLEAIQAIHSRHPNARILVLTTYDADEDIVKALRAGASGYLLKDTFPDALLEAIRSVAAGQRWLPTQIASRLTEFEQRPALSVREIEVLALVAKGLRNRDIGIALHVSEFTVKNHLHNILEKLEAADRTEAVTIAARRGIIQID